MPTHFSYQTHDAADPRNVLVCGSAQGIFCHADRPGSNRLYAHTVDAGGTAVREHWFTGEETAYAVGSAQCADAPEAADGKARAVEMGLEGMGPRTGCFLVLAIPNKQTPLPVARAVPLLTLPSASTTCDEQPRYRGLSGDGVARAACVSIRRDVTEGLAPPLDWLAVERPAGEPIVLTVLLYNTVRAPAGSAPEQLSVSKSDVELAIADMERLYGLCDHTCKLSQLPAMLHRLREEDLDRIRHVAKAARDPFVPRARAAAETAM